MAEFLPPDEMTLDGAAAALTAELAEGDDAVRETDRAFFDTFDALVREQGLSFVCEDGRIALVERDGGAVRAAIEAPVPTRPLMAQALPAGSLRDQLLEVTGVRALLPLVRVRSRTRPLRVLDDERKTVVRITLEEPALVAPGGRHTALGPRVLVAAVRGYDGELARVEEQLEHELGFKPADQPLVDEAVSAAGGAPGGIPSKIEVQFGYSQRADEAVARVLTRLLEVIEANVEGTIADIDSEFLHDLRVSVRRSRAVQRELGGVFPPEHLSHFRTEFRWLQQVTGDARDLDVYLLEFDDYRQMVPHEIRPDLDPLLGVLRTRRESARAEMASALRSGRAVQVRSQWAAFLKGLPALAAEDRPDALRPIGVVAGERIGKVYRRMVKMGSAIDDTTVPEAYHELRKKGKELRYLLELFGAPVYPGEVVKPMIKALKALQDVLGRHQDREVQVATLRSLREQVAPLPGGAAALMAMGVLVEHLGRDERAARGEFAERFAAFASSAQRQLVRETFP
jgi:CHAD domain-containing protein